MWDSSKDLFAWVGRLRDLYVLNTTVVDWQRFLQFLHESPYPLLFFVDDQPAAVPTDVTWVFAQREARSPLLTIQVYGMMLHCHFFWDKDIELDLDPREVTDEYVLDHLLEFMTAIGVALDKEVRLTEENTPDTVLFRYNPVRRQVEYVGV